MKKVSIFLSILLFSLVLIGCEKQSINGDDEVIEDDSIEILETPVTENDSIEDEVENDVIEIVETPVFDIPAIFEVRETYEIEFSHYECIYSCNTSKTTIYTFTILLIERYNIKYDIYETIIVLQESHTSISSTNPYSTGREIFKYPKNIYYNIGKIDFALNWFIDDRQIMMNYISDHQAIHVRTEIIG